jgi:manganese/zinc/iron transport system permease protein
MLVGPAVAARQWTDRLGVMLALAALFGAVSGVAGALISISQAHLPTGPMVILSLTAIVLLSLALAPSHGLLPEWLRRRALRRAGAGQDARAHLAAGPIGRPPRDEGSPRPVP